MLPWMVTIGLVSLGGLVWLLMKKKVEPLPRAAKAVASRRSFNVLSNMALVVATFSLYRFVLGVSEPFSVVAAMLAGAGLTYCNEYIEAEDIKFCALGMLVAGLLICLI